MAVDNSSRDSLVEDDMLAQLLNDITEAIESKEVDREYQSPLIQSRVGGVCEIGLILTDCSMPFIDGYLCS